MDYTLIIDGFQVLTQFRPGRGQLTQYLANLGLDPVRLAPYLRVSSKTLGVPNLSGGLNLIEGGHIGPKGVCAFGEGNTWHVFYSVLDFCAYITLEKPTTTSVIVIDEVDDAKHFIQTLPIGYMIHYPINVRTSDMIHYPIEERYEAILDFTISRGWSGGDMAHTYETGLSKKMVGHLGNDPSQSMTKVLQTSPRP